MSFDVSKIETKFSGLVGFKQPDDPNFFVLDSTNLASSSGYFVNDNPFAKLELLRDTQDYSEIDVAQFNAKLVSVMNSSINSVVSSVFSGVGSQDYLDSDQLFKYPMNRVNLESIPDGFVYEKIDVYKKTDIGIEISSVILDFDGTGDIEIRLYSTAKVSPVFTQTVTITEKSQTIDLNWKIDNTDGVIGGELYFGYDNTGLSVTPFKRDYDQSTIRSNYSCLRTNSGLISGFTGNDIWDLTKDTSISSTTGLNPYITMFNDFTDRAINNKSLFAEAINMECQIQFLNEYVASTRSNKSARLSKQVVSNIISETVVTDSGASFSKGLKPSLEAMIDRVQKQINKIERGYYGTYFNVVTLP